MTWNRQTFFLFFFVRNEYYLYMQRTTKIKTEKHQVFFSFLMMTRIKQIEVIFL